MSGERAAIKVIPQWRMAIDDLVEGALKQQRLLVIAPREPSADDLRQIIGDSMRNW